MDNQGEDGIVMKKQSKVLRDRVQTAKAACSRVGKQSNTTCALQHVEMVCRRIETLSKISNGSTQLDINPTHAIHLGPTRRLYC
jgi:2-iminoacetate synthase ThiH